MKIEGKTFDRKRSDVFLFYANLTERAKIEKYYQKWYKKGIKMLGDRQKVPENGHSYQEVYEQKTKFRKIKVLKISGVRVKIRFVNKCVLEIMTCF